MKCVVVRVRLVVVAGCPEGRGGGALLDGRRGVGVVSPTAKGVAQVLLSDLLVGGATAAPGVG